MISRLPSTTLFPYTTLFRSRRAANEGSAQQTLRTIHSSEATYQATFGNGNFGTMAELRTGNLIDSVLAVGTDRKSTRLISSHMPVAYVIFSVIIVTSVPIVTSIFT